MATFGYVVCSIFFVMLLISLVGCVIMMFRLRPGKRSGWCCGPGSDGAAGDGTGEKTRGRS